MKYNVYNSKGILILDSVEHWQLVQLIKEFGDTITFIEVE